jgi:hypothetical membrane protein
MLIRRYTLVSAAAAPLALGLGLALAPGRQPTFDSTRDSISALAGLAANDRWLMTAALVALGLAHIATASGLRGAGWPGRALLGLGGIATLLVTTFPLPVAGSSPAHFAAASLAFFCLSAWPLAASTRASGPFSLRVGSAASAALFGLLGWLVSTLQGERAIGLSERVVALAQALWPLCIVLVASRQRRVR